MTKSRIAAIASGLALAMTAWLPTAHATPPTNVPTTAADYGARWLASRFVSDGNGNKFIPATGSPTTPEPSNTMQAALALAAAGVEEATFDDAVDWLKANVTTTIAPGGTDNPGRLGYLLLVADAAGESPTSFGGVDLVTRLGNLRQTTGADTGLFGSADPTYDGTFRQSLAILGLRAVGQSVDSSSTTWLLGQQCAGGSNADDGGWRSYGGSTCDGDDADSNSTAFAIQALVSVSHTTYSGEVGDALGWLDAVQESDAGFAYQPAYASDPNSTSLVIQAIIAGGGNPTSATWQKSGGTLNPYTSLLSWQIGCTANPGDVGAFASPWSSGAPDLLATQQSVWGAAGAPFPLNPSFTTPTPTPCIP
ncbi:hypothetical protein [Embleya scabrispora]|nr:hypothetical protein [Embleya scabrispora]